MDIPLFNTETKSLRKQDQDLTEELTELEHKYQKIYKVAEDWLRYIYTACKGQVFIIRYGSLKNMIKECIRFLEHPGTYRRPPTPTVMTEGGEDPVEYADVDDLTKDELEVDIKYKKKKFQRFSERFARLDNLSKEYNNAKLLSIQNRYREMKRIIKEIIRD